MAASTSISTRAWRRAVVGAEGDGAVPLGGEGGEEIRGKPGVVLGPGVSAEDVNVAISGGGIELGRGRRCRLLARGRRSGSSGKHSDSVTGRRRACTQVRGNSSRPVRIGSRLSQERIHDAPVPVLLIKKSEHHATTHSAAKSTQTRLYLLKRSGSFARMGHDGDILGDQDATKSAFVLQRLP